jgi:hypothetical protein
MDSKTKVVNSEPGTLKEDKVRTADFDVAAFFVYHGYDYEIEREGNTIYFIFKGEGLNELLKQFPESGVNKVISIFFGLKKVAGTVLKGER